jgi:hypothetical protein
MFWQRQQPKVLKEFGAHIELYQKAYVISCLPPSQAFGISKEINNRAPIVMPFAKRPLWGIVLLKIEMPTSFKLYRWQRAGIIEAIDSARRTLCERAKIEQQWEPIFYQLDWDMHREIDKKFIKWSI